MFKQKAKKTFFRDLVVPSDDGSLLSLCSHLSWRFLSVVFVREQAALNKNIRDEIFSILNSDCLELASDQQKQHASNMLLGCMSWFVTKHCDLSQTQRIQGQDYRLRQVELLNPNTWFGFLFKIFFPRESLSVLVLESNQDRKIIFQSTRVTRLWSIFADCIPFENVAHLITNHTKERLINLIQNSDKKTELIGNSLGGALVKNHLMVPEVIGYARAHGLSAAVFNAPGTICQGVHNIAPNIQLTVVNQVNDYVGSLGHPPVSSNPDANNVKSFVYNPYPGKKNAGNGLMNHWVIGPLRDARPTTGYIPRKHLSDFSFFIVRPLVFICFITYMLVRTPIYWFIYRPISEALFQIMSLFVARNPQAKVKPASPGCLVNAVPSNVIEQTVEASDQGLVHHNNAMIDLRQDQGLTEYSSEEDLHKPPMLIRLPRQT